MVLVGVTDGCRIADGGCRNDINSKAIGVSVKSSLVFFMWLYSGILLP